MMMQHDQGSWLQRHIELHDHDDPVAERENSFTHAIGALLSLAWLVVVGLRWDSFKNQATAIGMLVYGCTLLFLYTSSTLYHSLARTDAKRVFRFLDHANIYFLIAGTYTPIMLYIGSEKTFMVLRLVWVVAVCGVVFSFVFWGRLKGLHVALYLAMGWMIIFFWHDIVPFLPDGLIVWIIAAGIAYSAGVVFLCE